MAKKVPGLPSQDFPMASELHFEDKQASMVNEQ